MESTLQNVRSSREEPLSATDEHGADNHLELVDKSRPYRLRGKFGTVNTDVVLDVGLEPPDRVGIELPFDSCPRAAGLGEGPGVRAELRCCWMP
jgi:hypothetical protein